jgi:hypothetical protein
LEVNKMMRGARVENLGQNYLGSRGEAWRLHAKNGKSSIVVTQDAARIIDVEREGRKVTWSNPGIMFPQLPAILAKLGLQGLNRENVSWDDMNMLGGEKTLIAPQGDGVPFPIPNLSRFDAEPIRNGIQLISPVCPESGFQVVREISVTDQATFEVSAYLVNHSKPKSAAPWSVMQLQAPATVEYAGLSQAPQAFECFGALPEGVLTKGDDRFLLQLNHGEQEKMWKVGGNLRPEITNASVRAKFPEQHVTLWFNSVVEANRTFPHGYSLEVFRGPKYWEHEILAPLELVGKDQRTQTLTYRFWLEQLG